MSEPAFWTNQVAEMSGPFLVLLGLLLAPQLWPAFLAGIPLATIATLINLTVGRRFSRHGVVLSFALNASLIAAFAYLI